MRNFLKRQEMERIVRIAALVSVLLVAVGCSPCERLARRCPPIEYMKDSIVVHDTLIRETTIRDTVLEVRLIKEYVYVQASINDTARAETSYAYGMAWLDGARVILSMRNKDSAEVLTQRIITLERQLRETSRKKETIKVQTVYKTRWIVKVAAWFGLIAAVGLLLIIAIRIIRR